MARSSIFLNSITCIDHGILTKEGIVVGGSYMLSVVVDGDVPEDDPEQVVIDFSKCKKLIKACIDDNENGFDHKLWVDPKYCDLTIVDGRYNIRTESTVLELPQDGVKIINHDNLLLQMNQQIQDYLSSYYPTIDIKTISTISALADDQPGPNKQRRYFNYVHGLKNSSSYGCQTVHGHTSYYEYTTNGDDVTAPDYSNIVFIFAENIVENVHWLTIVYITPARGYFKFSILKDKYAAAGIAIRIIPTETTIEHLVNIIANDFGDDISKITSLVTSEGLQKGARYIAPNL